jgi:hypothetical protein
MNLKTKQMGVNTNRTSFLSWNCTDITARSNKREDMMLDDMNNTNTTENRGGGGILVLRNESSFCSTDDARHATIEYCCKPGDKSRMRKGSDCNYENHLC